VNWTTNSVDADSISKTEAIHTWSWLCSSLYMLQLIKIHIRPEVWRSK